MWTRREIKTLGKRSLGKNYLSCIIVSFIMIIVVSGVMSISETITYDTKVISTAADLSGSKYLKDFSESVIKFGNDFKKDTSLGSDSSEGVIANIYHTTTKSGSITTTIINMLSASFIHNQTAKSLMIFIGFLISLLFYIFVDGILKIGSRRFFMENTLYSDTHLTRIFFIYKLRRVCHCAWIMFLETVFFVLWCLTIVGGPIKLYSYKMIPFILAENPNATRIQAFKLSMRMMRGNKWKAFKLDVSYLPWLFLSLITFGIVKYLYWEPYYRATYAELYLKLREEAKNNNYQYADVLNDKYLTKKPTEMGAAVASETFNATETFGDAEESGVTGTGDAEKSGFIVIGDAESSDGTGIADADVYPTQLFTIPEREGTRWITVDYHRDYSIWNLILLFFSFSMFGWLWECGLEFVEHGDIVNRGSLYGPWIPIYGFGGIFLLILLKKAIDKPLLTFFLAVVVCGVLEYTTAWYLDTFRHMKYWDYSGYFFNIQGRICLEGLLVFGLGGCMFIYIIAPILDNVFNKIPKKDRIGICAVLVALFATDAIYAHFKPHVGEGIGGYVDGGQGDGLESSQIIDQSINQNIDGRGEG